MKRVLWTLLKGLGITVYCLLVGLMGTLVIWTFTAVGLQWLGVVIALMTAVSFYVNLANMV